MGDNQGTRHVAGAGSRILGVVVDAIVLLSVYYLLEHFVDGLRFGAWSLVSALLAGSYQIVCVGVWGRTIGKVVARTAVVAVNGSSAGWTRAILRNVPALPIGLVESAAKATALQSIGPAVYLSMTSRQRLAALAAAMPAWGVWSRRLSYAYVALDIIVFFSNSRRRALHDYIAGTVVVSSGPPWFASQEVVLLSEATLERLRALFPLAEQDVASELLKVECGCNFPGHESGSPESLERVRFAVLKLSQGDVSKLRETIASAKSDWMGVVTAAGFGSDEEAHRRWHP